MSHIVGSSAHHSIGVTAPVGHGSSITSTTNGHGIDTTVTHSFGNSGNTGSFGVGHGFSGGTVYHGGMTHSFGNGVSIGVNGSHFGGGGNYGGISVSYGSGF